MALTVIGLNFNTAPLKIREQIHFRATSLEAAYATLRAQSANSPIKGAVILATCNRVELYTYGEHHEKLFSASLQFIAQFHNIAPKSITPFMYRMHGARAVLHLFKVAAGLKSMVVGENQVLSQLKQAYAEARHHDFSSTEISRAFEQALAVGKRVRTQTQINRGGTSIGSVAIDFVKELYGKHTRFSVTLLGAGEIGEEVLKALTQHGTTQLTLVNRNIKKAQTLGKRFHAQSKPLSERYTSIVTSDIVISSVESPTYLIEKQPLISALNKKSKVIIFIDLSVPRSIDPAVEDLEDIVLYTIDDLKKVIDRTMLKRQKEIQAALEIINDFEEEFSLWETKRAFLHFLENFKGAPDEAKRNARRYHLEKYPNAHKMLNPHHIKEMEKLVDIFLTKKKPR